MAVLTSIFFRASGSIDDKTFPMAGFARSHHAVLFLEFLSHTTASSRNPHPWSIAFTNFKQLLWHVLVCNSQEEQCEINKWHQMSPAPDYFCCCRIGKTYLLAPGIFLVPMPRHCHEIGHAWCTCRNKMNFHDLDLNVFLDSLICWYIIYHWPIPFLLLAFFRTNAIVNKVHPWFYSKIANLDGRLGATFGLPGLLAWAKPRHCRLWVPCQSRREVGWLPNCPFHMTHALR